MARDDGSQRAADALTQLAIRLPARKAHRQGRPEKLGLQLRRKLIEAHALDFAEVDLPKVGDLDWDEPMLSRDRTRSCQRSLERARVNGVEVNRREDRGELVRLLRIPGLRMAAEHQPRQESPAATTSSTVSQSSVTAPRQSPVAPPSQRRYTSPRPIATRAADTATQTASPLPATT